MVAAALTGGVAPYISCPAPAAQEREQMLRGWQSIGTRPICSPMCLLAILLPPLAIPLSGRPFQAVTNVALWLLGLTMIALPFVPGFVTWALAAGRAVLLVCGRGWAEHERHLVEDAAARHEAARPS